MNPNSAVGPDCMNGYFFQNCWHIIMNDMMGIIHSFFSRHIIPKYFFHTVLLAKVSNLKKLIEFRRISLGNFTSKIKSKQVCNRLSPILPSLISPNQSEFVKGRSISENIIIAQEIIHQISKSNIGINVIIKFDMAKNLWQGFFVVYLPYSKKNRLFWGLYWHGVDNYGQ